jgi:hypothetical protein
VAIEAVPEKEEAMIHKDDLVSIVNSRPDGFTSKQIAAELGYEINGLSSRLTKLRSYGDIGGRVLPKKRGQPYRREIQWLPKNSPLSEPVDFSRQLVVAPQVEAEVVRLELDGTPRKIMRYQTQLTDELIKRVLQKNMLTWKRVPGTGERAPLPEQATPEQAAAKINRRKQLSRLQRTEAYLMRLRQEQRQP